MCSVFCCVSLAIGVDSSSIPKTLFIAFSTTFSISCVVFWYSFFLALYPPFVCVNETGGLIKPVASNAKSSSVNDN